jgi:anti-sigma factor RsiW
MSQTRTEILLMKAVDGVLSVDEERELDALLEAQPELAEELDDYRDIKEVTDAMTQRILADAHIEPPRPTAAARGAIGLGWSALLVGYVLLLGYGGYVLSLDNDVPTTIKLGIGALAFGGLILFGYALRVRLRASGRDPYEEIDR